MRTYLPKLNFNVKSSKFNGFFLLNFKYLTVHSKIGFFSLIVFSCCYHRSCSIRKFVICFCIFVAKKKNIQIKVLGHIVKLFGLLLPTHTQINTIWHWLAERVMIRLEAKAKHSCANSFLWTYHVLCVFIEFNLV